MNTSASASPASSEKTTKAPPAGAGAKIATGGAPAPKEAEAGANKCTTGNVDIEFDEIQGNIFGGFSKDHQVNLFFAFDQAEHAKQTLGPTDEDDPKYPGSIFGHVKHSNSSAVLAFNEQFRAIRRAGLPEGSILATWTNLVFTHEGMKFLGNDLSSFGEAKSFTTGMIGQADLIGDTAVNTNDPKHWNDGMDVSIDWAKVHGLLIVASDDPAQLDPLNPGGRLAKYLVKLQAKNSGVTVLGLIRGETRVDQPGHEHFGFKDGVSQPGVRGVDAPSDPLHNPDQGNPGQDLLHPGEFVLGYPTQIGNGLVLDGKHVDGPNPCQGPDSGEGLPDWVKNGSFLVFRRLAQDVKGFRTAVAKTAASLGLSSDLLGAKIVGRFASGAPLEALKFQAGTDEYQVPLVDPGVADPALANSDALNNCFEYGEDPAGDIVPIAAHIRKAYPRDQVPKQEDNQALPNDIDKDGVAESRTQTHRLLRRGIPFGKSLGMPEGGDPDDARGLLFLAYQSDIARQFEFVQRSWVNDENFPKIGAGQDPIITNKSHEGAISGCPFHAGANASKCPSLKFQHFVKTRGGGYFFSPSISILQKWLG